MKKLIIIGGISICTLIGIVIFLLAISLRGMNMPTGAMSNALIPGDQFVAERWVGEIKRGDVLVFRLPMDQKILYVMRVVGLPNEKIQFRGKRVFINGTELAERRALTEYQDDPSAGSYKEISAEGSGKYTAYYFDDSWAEKFPTPHEQKYGASEPYQIPQGQYFVLGDARDNSLDSRYWGTVPADNFVARPLVIYASRETARIFTKIQ